MRTLFEQQGVQYEMQGEYRLPCVTLPNDSNYKIGVFKKMSIPQKVWERK